MAESEEQGQGPQCSVPVDYFKLVGDSSVKGNYIFKCKICSCNSKIFSANFKSRANLKKHIITKNSDSTSGFDAWCKANDQRKGTIRSHEDANNIEVMPSQSQPKPCQSTIDRLPSGWKEVHTIGTGPFYLEHIAESVTIQPRRSRGFQRIC